MDLMKDEGDTSLTITADSSTSQTMSNFTLEGFSVPDNVRPDTWLFPVPGFEPKEDEVFSVTELLNQLETEEVGEVSLAEALDSSPNYLSRYRSHVPLNTSRDSSTMTTTSGSENREFSEKIDDGTIVIRKENNKSSLGQINFQHDLTDLKVTTKMQEQILQRSAIEKAKLLVGSEDCDYCKRSTNQNSKVGGGLPTILVSPGSRTPRSNRRKPPKQYGIRSNTQTLRVSPAAADRRQLNKYQARSNTQTLSVPPTVTPTRALSTPRRNGTPRSTSKPSRGNDPVSSYVPSVPFSYVAAHGDYQRDKGRFTNNHKAETLGSDRSSRVNKTAKPSPFQDLLKRSQSSGPPSAVGHLNGTEMYRQPSRPNIVRPIVGGSRPSLNTMEKSAAAQRPSMLPRLNANVLGKFRSRLELQSTNL